MSNTSSWVGSILCHVSSIFTSVFVYFVVVVVTSVGVVIRAEDTHSFLFAVGSWEPASLVHQSPRTRVCSLCPSDKEHGVTSLNLHLPQNTLWGGFPSPAHCLHYPSCTTGGGGGEGGGSSLFFPEIALTDLGCPQLSLEETFLITPPWRKLKICAYMQGCS